MRISVVVSTFNGATELPRLFAALNTQTINGHAAWDLIVVDNGSTDDTAPVVKALTHRARFTVRYIYEGRRGKSHGLNAGIAAARGPIVAFTDDDGVPAPDWLENIVRHFDTYPDAACVGGRVELYDSADAPVTVRLSRDSARTDIASFSPSNIPVIGCNMVISAQALRDIGRFDIDFGPGSRIGAAEDLDILYRLVGAGYSIDYDPRMLVLHNHGRRTSAEIESVTSTYAVGRGAFYCKYVLRADRRVARRLYWELAHLAKQWLRAGLVTSAARKALRIMSLLAVGAIRYPRYRSMSRRENAPCQDPK